MARPVWGKGEAREGRGRGKWGQGSEVERFGLARRNKEKKKKKPPAKRPKTPWRPGVRPRPQGGPHPSRALKLIQDNTMIGGKLRSGARGHDKGPHGHGFRGRGGTRPRSIVRRLGKRKNMAIAGKNGPTQPVGEGSGLPHQEPVSLKMHAWLGWQTTQARRPRPLPQPQRHCQDPPCFGLVFSHNLCDLPLPGYPTYPFEAVSSSALGHATRAQPESRVFTA